MNNPSIELEKVAGILVRAVWFASCKHKSQRRKDTDATPYINHPLDVCHILWFEGGIRRLDVLAAAVLHDTLEDTDTEYEELASVFGSRIADLVREVTDDTSLPKEVRKLRQVESAPGKSRGAKLVKLGDKISNLRDIQRGIPRGWTEQRAMAYVHWAHQVVAGCRGVNVALEAAFDEVYQSFPGVDSP